MFAKRKTAASLMTDRALKFAAEPPLHAVRRPKDKRAPVRDRTWHQCSISGTGGYRLSAIVVDYSGSGLRLRFHGHEMLPDDVTVNVAALGIKRRCAVVWCERGDAGLKFV